MHAPAPEIRLEFTIRTYDIDYAGHVSNQVYVRWLEDLRFALLEAHYPLRPQMEAGIVPVLTRTDIRYKRALKLFEQPVGVMRLEEPGKLRVVLQAEISTADGPAATARQEAVFVRMDTGRPVRVPEQLRSLYRNYITSIEAKE
jgi:acyl-CoA thioester hydrolase